MSQPEDTGKTDLVFLKLGGSLITDKSRPAAARLEVIERLAGEIAAAVRMKPGLQLLLGHGSGSFGHVPAKHYGTRQGVFTAGQWQGFTEVWRQAAALNRILMDALAARDLYAIAFPPSASVTARDGALLAWDTQPLRAALDAGLLPVVFGDVVFDTVRGGTIFSTEDLFDSLAPGLQPRRILLAGIEPGVWADYPACTRLMDEITPQTLAQVLPSLSGARADDVTGGMQSKVLQSMALVEQIPGLEVLIFSGEVAGLVQQALLGESPGTRVRKFTRP